MNEIIYIFNIHDEKKNCSKRELELKLLNLFHSIITANGFLTGNITIYCDFDTMYILSVLPFDFELNLNEENAIIEVNKKLTNDVLLISGNQSFNINDNINNINKHNGLIYRKTNKKEITLQELKKIKNKISDIEEDKLIENLKNLSIDIYNKFDEKLKFVMNYI